MYAITGASGHTGGMVARTLLDAGKKVRVIGRDARRLEALTRRGAELFLADARESGPMAQAFSGAEGVYAMIPPNVTAPDVLAYSRQAGESLAEAIERVRNVVMLSSIGADKPAGTGPVVGLHGLEERLRAVGGLNAVALRAGYFMENLLPQAGIIRQAGMMAGPLRADLPLPMIATRDIGAAAAELLISGGFSGFQTRELLGQREVTYAEVASIIGRAIGRPDLRYTQLPAGQLKPMLQQMGMSASMADLLLEMCDALNSGYMKALEPRSARNTTPTSVETFVAEVFVPAFQAGATEQ